ncbi:hypothetical protein [Clostridium perfringens]|uniref:hypothetical protein n=1 Tax=Clostridium perfringens TaxID=1502 RepID=UPI0009931C41|nr:hypothetical protein [Clostridium perfringens]QTZ83047.1 hypothetical protein phiCPE_00071 [Clostridium phage vB_CpeS-1181]AQW28492.1 hypothetical protein BXT94_17365 [Clostridium perfringens]PWW86630.1 hypothetical protein CYK79_16950 [Clostridium perfringens]PWW90333.1 hypothetical protein CYK84_14355 [Clostridium perfringens]PWX64940.1 hypothetical protein CYK78_15915 [Clostridium perfringens]
MEDEEYLKLKYNYYLKKIKKANSYLRNCSKENYKKYYPKAMNLINKIDEVIVKLKKLNIDFDVEKEFEI